MFKITNVNKYFFFLFISVSDFIVDINNAILGEKVIQYWYKMRNASSLPRLNDVTDNFEDLQSTPSSRRTTYRYFYILTMEFGHINADIMDSRR